MTTTAPTRNAVRYDVWLIRVNGSSKYAAVSTAKVKVARTTALTISCRRTARGRSAKLAAGRSRRFASSGILTVSSGAPRARFTRTG